MKWLTLILIVLLVPARAEGQHYIGKHKSEVKQGMKEDSRDLFLDETSRNPVYNMIKYVDNLGNQTLIFFFSEEDTCLYSKWMCDYSMLNKVVSELNGKYQASAEDSWHYTSEGKDFRIKLTTGDWFFTITTKPEKKQ